MHGCKITFFFILSTGTGKSAVFLTGMTIKDKQKNYFQKTESICFHVLKAGTNKLEGGAKLIVRAAIQILASYFVIRAEGIAHAELHRNRTSASATTVILDSQFKNKSQSLWHFQYASTLSFLS